MKVKAAIAFEAAKPMVVDEVDLEGPKQGEVLVRHIDRAGPIAFVILVELDQDVDLELRRRVGDEACPKASWAPLRADQHRGRDELPEQRRRERRRNREGK